MKIVADVQGATIHASKAIERAESMAFLCKVPCQGAGIPLSCYIDLQNMHKRLYMNGRCIFEAERKPAIPTSTT